MSLRQLDDYLERNVPQEDRKKLLMAIWRYMHLIGIVDNVIEPEVVAQDKQTYPHFIKQANGYACWVEKDCVEFMAEVTGLPAEWCNAWMRRDMIMPLES